MKRMLAVQAWKCSNWVRDNQTNMKAALLLCLIQGICSLSITYTRQTWVNIDIDLKKIFKSIFLSNIYIYIYINAYPDGPDWRYRMLLCDLDLSQVGNGCWCPSLGWMDCFVLECIEGRGSGRFDLFPERQPVACLLPFLLELWRNYIV